MSNEWVVVVPISVAVGLLIAWIDQAWVPRRWR